MAPLRLAAMLKTVTTAVTTTNSQARFASACCVGGLDDPVEEEQNPIHACFRFELYLPHVASTLLSTKWRRKTKTFLL
jgi:hypothetical protein